MVAASFSRSLRLALITFAVMAYVTLVGLPARLGELALWVLALASAVVLFLGLRRVNLRGALDTRPPTLVLFQGAVAGVILGALMTVFVGLFATLIGSGVRVQPVFDKMVPPNVAAFYSVEPQVIVQAGLGVVDWLRVALGFGLGGMLSGVLVLLARALRQLREGRSGDGRVLRRLIYPLPFVLLAFVLWLGDPTVTLGGNNKGTLRLLAVLFTIATGLFALRVAQTDLAGSSRAQRTAYKLFTLALLGGIALLPFTLDQFQNAVMGIVFIFVMMGLGLNIVVGFAGLLDLGYVAFFAIGAYVYAFVSAPFSSPWLSQQLAALGVPTSGPLLNFWVALLLTMLFGIIGGVLLGVPVLRLRGDYLAIVTLGFGEIIRLFMLNLADLTNGPRGLLRIAPPTIFDYNLGNPRDIFILALLGTGLVAFVAHRLEGSRLGRAWIAMREDEDVARATGINLVQTKLLAFAIGAMFAAVAGQLYAARQTNIFPDNFTLFVSIDALSLVIVGGMGSIPGVILGAIALKGLPEVLRGVDEYRIVTFAALLVIMMVARPEGILPSLRRQRELHEAEAVEAETLADEPSSLELASREGGRL